MRAAFRTLGTLTALLWGFFVIGATDAIAATPYKLRVSGDYFSSRQELCNSAWVYTDYGSQTSKWKLIGAAYNDNGPSGYCVFNIQNLEDGRSYYGQGLTCGSSICYYDILPECSSGETKTLYFSGDVAIVGGTPYASATAPSNYCIQGCNYNRSSNQLACSINGETSNCSFSFVSDAAACNSSPPASEGEDPTQPPSTGGDTGGTGGDTGGDTGGTGGDTGGTGGDTGGTGGDTGGTGGDTGGTGGDTGGTGGDTGGDTGETGTLATSGDIDRLGDRVVGAITQLGDRLSAQLEALGGLGTSYDSSAEWSDAEAGAVGGAAGDGVSDALGSAVDGAVAEHEGQVEDALSDVPGQVGDMLGNNPALDSLRNILPSASGCSDYTIPFTVLGYSINFTLPVCLLSSIKPLLEWLIWCLTAIGLWNIFYSGLRLENAKASKGGH